MSAKTGQRAGPNKLKFFFREPRGISGVKKAKQIEIIWFQKIKTFLKSIFYIRFLKFHGQHRVLQLVCYKQNF